jgi:hypothetical protein
MPEDRTVRFNPAVALVLFVIWLILLLPWLLFAGLSGMAFDAGNALRAYVYLFSLWTYPVSVWVVWKFREERPAIALFPMLNLLGVFSDVLWKSN